MQVSFWSLLYGYPIECSKRRAWNLVKELRQYVYRYVKQSERSDIDKTLIKSKFFCLLFSF